MRAAWRAGLRARLTTAGLIGGALLVLLPALPAAGPPPSGGEVDQRSVTHVALVTGLGAGGSGDDSGNDPPGGSAAGSVGSVVLPGARVDPTPSTPSASRFGGAVRPNPAWGPKKQVQQAPRAATLPEPSRDPASRASDAKLRNESSTAGQDLWTEEWKAVDGVKGPAKGRTLEMPNKRHFFRGIKKGNVSESNSVVMRGYEGAVADDIQGIAEGRGTWVEKGGRYEINGRTYFIESNGAVSPDSGPGIVKLDRNEYSALQRLAEVGGDPAAVKEFSTTPRYVNNPQVISRAVEIWNAANGTNFSVPEKPPTPGLGGLGRGAPGESSLGPGPGRGIGGGEITGGGRMLEN